MAAGVSQTGDRLAVDEGIAGARSDNRTATDRIANPGDGSAIDGIFARAAGYSTWAMDRTIVAVAYEDNWSHT